MGLAGALVAALAGTFATFLATLAGAFLAAFLPGLLAAFLVFAHRAFCAAAILARASGLNLRFRAGLVAVFRGCAVAEGSAGAEGSVPARIARTCSSLEISALSCETIALVSIYPLTRWNWIHLHGNTMAGSYLGQAGIFPPTRTKLRLKSKNLCLTYFSETDASFETRYRLSQADKSIAEARLDLNAEALLTQELVFDRLISHHLGCPGSRF